MKISPEQLSKYKERRLEDLSSLKKFLTQKDFDSIASIGHKLKGNGATFGFDKITEIGQRLEKAALTNSSDDIKDLISQLDQFLIK